MVDQNAAEAGERRCLLDTYREVRSKRIRAGSYRPYLLDTRKCGANTGKHFSGVILETIAAPVSLSVTTDPRIEIKSLSDAGRFKATGNPKRERGMFGKCLAFQSLAHASGYQVSRTALIRILRSLLK